MHAYTFIMQPTINKDVTHPQRCIEGLTLYEKLLNICFIGPIILVLSKRLERY